MNRFLLFSLLALLMTLSTLACAQTASDSQSTYKDYVLDGSSAWLLMNNGQLKHVRWSTDTDSSVVHTDTSIAVLGLDRKGNLTVGDVQHQIKRFEKNSQQWSMIATYQGQLHRLVFDSTNTCFAITDKGIVHLKSNQIYFPEDKLYLNDQTRNRKTWYAKPISFIDKQDRIWVGFDHGEWGGDVFVFDTHSRKFLQLSADSIHMNMNPVTGFCEDSQHVYMSCGVSHMMLTHGSIVRFTNQVAHPILQSKDVETPTKMSIIDPKTGKERTVTGNTWAGGQFIGPIAYNSTNNCLYFYSQNGLHRCNLNADLSNINNWKRILNPKLRWTGGRSNAVGSAMNVLKMQFTPDSMLVFLTEHDGLVLYNGLKLRFLK